MSLRVGLIGAGGISRAHLPSWLSIGAQVSVYSVAGAEELVDDFGAGTVVGSLEELFAACDIVDVVTPTATHREVVELALRAGKHVVCEKPLGRHLDDARAIMELAAELDRMVFPGHVVRFFPEYAVMHQAVVDGVIGKPAVARFTRTGSFPEHAAWFGDENASGGVVLDLMLHDLDMARWTLGEVTEVYATSSSTHTEAGAYVSAAQAVLTHASGAISYVRGVWGPPGTTFWTSFNVAGDHGVLRFDTREEKSLQFDGLPSSRGGELLPDLSFVESPYLTQLREFANAFEGGPKPRVSCADGVVAVGLALAALESIETGVSVSIAEGGQR